MLTPKKHSNLDLSVLRISALMLRELQKRGAIEFEKLRLLINKKAGKDAEFVFYPALDLLFILGRLEYHVKNDMLEFRGD